MSTGVAARAAALLGLGTLLVLAGMWLGHDMATTQAQAAREKAATVALQRYQQAVADGQQAVGAVQEQLRLQKSYSATLDERQRHAPPLTVPLPRCPRGVGPVVADGAAGPAAGAGPAGAGEGAAPGAAGPGVPGAPVDEGGAVDGGGLVDLSLSLAAVSLWNSALAGHDVSAGACRADATAEPACAAAAGITLDEAWANHRANAATCAADRARHQGLIDYLSRRAHP